MSDLIQDVCTSYRIDSSLLSAIISVESNWNPKLMRYEPGYKWLYNTLDYASALTITQDTETVLQKSSFGLCQVMGAVAREQGFNGYLTDLLDPALNLEHACKLLRRLSDTYGYEPAVISAYNQGSPRKTPGGMYVNQTYVDKVDKFIRESRKLV